MNPILRVLGVGLFESVASRLSPRAGVVVQFALVIVGSLFPIIPLLTGAIHLADLLAYTVLAMALSVAGVLIRLRTMTQQRGTDTTFWMIHYSAMVGIMSFVCGVWAIVLLVRVGPSGGWFALLPMAAALLLGHAWSLADGWFTRGGREVTRVGQIVLPGYLRVGPLLFATVFAAAFYLGDSSTAPAPIAVGIALVLVQTIIDLALAVWAQRIHSR